LPGKVLEVVTYNVNLEIWTTAQREAEKGSRGGTLRTAAL